MKCFIARSNDWMNDRLNHLGPQRLARASGHHFHSILETGYYLACNVQKSCYLLNCSLCIVIDAQCGARLRRDSPPSSLYSGYCLAGGFPVVYRPSIAITTYSLAGYREAPHRPTNRSTMAIYHHCQGCHRQRFSSRIKIRDLGEISN